SLPLMMTFNPDKEGVRTTNVTLETDDLTWDYNLSGNGYVPTIHISNIDFGSINISEDNDTYKGSVMIKNSSATVEGANSDITIRSVLVDPSSPNADQFTNFRIEGTNTPISEIDGLVLPVGESIKVEFDLKADGTEGNKFARLSVISDAGPATNNGEIPSTENNIGYEFDGEFTVNNKSGLDDGGYIQAKLINKTQSSFEDELINNGLQMKLLSSNPLNSETISLEIMNANSSNVFITISDINGNVISTLFDGKVSNNSPKEFSIKGMAAGVYFINATNGDSQVITKLIIEK
ncbi:MAG: T9SS type A sorting domain-containing protein, partial [Candidatus Kapaibacterium sp.]